MPLAKEAMMSIAIETRDAAVMTPARLELISVSGANVEVFVFIGDLPALRHAFVFDQSSVTKALPALTAGVHAATVVVRALKNLNRMYSLIVGINGETVAVADGDIAADRNSDSGTADFTLTVGGAA
jgi:hypothetical protein